MASVLDNICAQTRLHVEAAKNRNPLTDIKKRLSGQPPARGFLSALRERAQSAKPAIIAEVKKASPSKGLIREDFDPAAIARTYQDNGATCVSVLTDGPFFQGHDDDLRAVKAAISLPVLRKDFMIDEYQIYESRALGADCVLLIMACLEDAQAADYFALACALGMDVLVEVHDAAELERAKLFHPPLIGINNRNLKTLKVDVQTSRDLIGKMPAGALKVSESGITDPATLKTLHDDGFEAFLVGESLMRQTDIGRALRSLLGNTV